MTTYPQGYKLTIQQTVIGNTGIRKPIDNVLCYGTPTPAGTITALSLPFLTAWKSNLEATWLAFHDFSCRLDTYLVQSLDRPDVAWYEENPALTGTYNSTPGAPAPSINAAFFFLKSNASGRSSHGGIHAGGLPLVGIQGNEFSTAYQSVLNGWFTSYLLGFTDSLGIVWSPIILSRKNSSLSMPPPAVSLKGYNVALADSALDKDVGTMRRRKERTAR